MLPWKNGGYIVQVIKTEITELYPFVKTPYASCTLKPVISYLNATGKWESFNLSGNELEVKNPYGQLSNYLQIKVSLS